MSVFLSRRAHDELLSSNQELLQALFRDSKSYVWNILGVKFHDVPTRLYALYLKHDRS